MSITPRVRRLRDRYLCVLAARRGLPAPSAASLAADDSLTLEEIINRWAEQQPAVTGTALGENSQRFSNVGRWPRSRRIVGLLVGAVAAGMIVGVAVRWPGLIVRRAAAGDVAQWTVLTDSVAAAEREKLLDVSDAPLTISIGLSAGDVAALVLDRPDRWRGAVQARVSARIDSVLWLRGMAPDGRRFSLSGTVKRVRAGRGELRVLGLWIDSVAVPSRAAAEALSSLGLAGVHSGGVIRFGLPRYVLDVQLRGRTATVITRPSGDLPAQAIEGPSPASPAHAWANRGGSPDQIGIVPKSASFYECDCQEQTSSRLIVPAFSPGQSALYPTWRVGPAAAMSFALQFSFASVSSLLLQGSTGRAQASGVAQRRTMVLSETRAPRTRRRSGRRRPA